MSYDVEIKVKTLWIEKDSDPAIPRYVFAYTISITNRSSVSMQLISRHWIITDEKQQVQEVKGQGVVGQQPVFAPGASFTYTSSVILPTEVGSMRGTYQMRLDSAEEFDAEIPEFILVHPKRLH